MSKSTRYNENNDSDFNIKMLYSVKELSYKLTTKALDSAEKTGLIKKDLFQGDRSLFSDNEIKKQKEEFNRQQTKLKTEFEENVFFEAAKSMPDFAEIIDSSLSASQHKIHDKLNESYKDLLNQHVAKNHKSIPTAKKYDEAQKDIDKKIKNNPNLLHDHAAKMPQFKNEEKTTHEQVMYATTNEVLTKIASQIHKTAVSEVAKHIKQKNPQAIISNIEEKIGFSKDQMKDYIEIQRGIAEHGYSSGATLSNSFAQTEKDIYDKYRSSQQNVIKQTALIDNYEAKKAESKNAEQTKGKRNNARHNDISDLGNIIKNNINKIIDFFESLIKEQKSQKIHTSKKHDTVKLDRKIQPKILPKAKSRSEGRERSGTIVLSKGANPQSLSDIVPENLKLKNDSNNKKNIGKKEDNNKTKNHPTKPNKPHMNKRG